MSWIIIITVAALLGWVTSLFTQKYGLGATVCLPIAILGAVLGGVLTHISPNAFGAYSFYIMAFLFALLALAGGTLWSYTLTGREHRV